MQVGKYLRGTLSNTSMFDCKNSAAVDNFLYFYKGGLKKNRVWKNVIKILALIASWSLEMNLLLLEVTWWWQYVHTHTAEISNVKVWTRTEELKNFWKVIAYRIIRVYVPFWHFRHSFWFLNVSYTMMSWMYYTYTCVAQHSPLMPYYQQL